MKFIARLMLIAIFTYLLSMYLPWWIVFVNAFVITFLIHGSGINAFLSGFLGSGLVWMVYAWILDLNNQSVFSGQLVSLFPVDEPILLVIGAGLIGAVCGALGGWCGNSFKKLFIKKQVKSFYS